MFWLMLIAVVLIVTTLPLLNRRPPMPLEDERKLPSVVFQKLDGIDEADRNALRLPRFYDRYAVHVEREAAERKQIAGQKIKDRFNLSPLPRRFLVRNVDRMSDIEDKLRRLNEASPVLAVFPTNEHHLNPDLLLRAIRDRRLQIDAESTHGTIVNIPRKTK